jgi:hypothetical protein
LSNFQIDFGRPGFIVSGLKLANAFGVTFLAGISERLRVTFLGLKLANAFGVIHYP